VPKLMYPSRTRATLSVCRTRNGQPGWRSPFGQPASLPIRAIASSAASSSACSSSPKR
jgi:hypothetical protein